MNPPVDQAMAARAVAIADSCMRSAIECEGTPVAELEAGRWAPVDFGSARRVATIAEADEFFLEAWEWLRDRGLAHVEKDALGEIVVLELEKFE